MTRYSALDSNWCGISHVKKEATALHTIFSKEIAEEEFGTSISIALTNTAPSLTGLIFNTIKNWPEVIYSTLNLWSTNNVTYSGNGNGVFEAKT